MRRPSRARRRQWMREAAQAAAQAAVQAAQAAAAQVAQAHVDEDEVVDLMADEAGGGVATLINAGLFVFMVVFAVGCGLLGWFG